MKFKDFLKESTKQETFIVNAKKADEFIELLDNEDVEYEVLTQDRNELIVSVLDSTKRILKLAKRLGALFEANKTKDLGLTADDIQRARAKLLDSQSKNESDFSKLFAKADKLINSGKEENPIGRNPDGSLYKEFRKLRAVSDDIAEALSELMNQV